MSSLQLAPSYEPIVGYATIRPSKVDIPLPEYELTGGLFRYDFFTQSRSVQLVPLRNQTVGRAVEIKFSVLSDATAARGVTAAEDRVFRRAAMRGSRLISKGILRAK